VKTSSTKIDWWRVKRRR